MHYGGLGAQATIRLREDDRGWHRQGGFVSGAGVVERRSYAAIDPGSDGSTLVPSPGLFGGARLAGGYDDRWLGVRGGLIAFQYYQYSGTHFTRKVTVFPDLALRVGPQGWPQLDVGLGSYNLPTLTRPGLYVGLGYEAESGWKAAVHTGSHESFEAHDGGARYDVELKVPIADKMRIGAGAAFSEGWQGRSEMDARLLLETVL
jgi:hypothetical protein